MKVPLQIAVDLLGGDTSPAEFISFFKDNASLFSRKVHLKVFIAEESEAVKTPKLPSNIEISFLKASQFIHMEDEPAKAVRHKKNSSLVQGIQMLKERKIDGLISTGNTGALLAASKIYSKTFPDISRPALLALIPTKKHPIAVLDVGANISCKPHQFLEFANLGTAFQKTLGVEYPKTGLLNIGVEKQKGRNELRQAYLSLQQMKNFTGNIEGREVFEGNIHVLVTDGFTGNIFLKTAEGVSSFILDQLKNVSSSELGKIKKELNYNKYPGAIIAGVDGLIIKCHGYSSPHSIFLTLQKMIALIDQNFLSIYRNNYLSLLN
ncbi:MAG: phosphate acyltransferase PlsX [Simkaniaceae bacterium]